MEKEFVKYELDERYLDTITMLEDSLEEIKKHFDSGGRINGVVAAELDTLLEEVDFNISSLDDLVFSEVV